MKTETATKLLREIVCEGCLTYSESRDLECFYCGGSVNFNVHGPDTVNHTKDCVFERINQALKNQS